MRAMTIVAAEAMANHRAAAPTPAGAFRVSTTTRLMAWPLAIGTGRGTRTAAHANRPRWPLTGWSLKSCCVSTLLTLSSAGKRDGLVGPDRFVHVERVVERAVVADPDHSLAL